MEIHKPIAALSSGSGPGGVAVIRISGAGSHQLVQAHFRFRKKPSHISPSPGKLYLGDFVDPSTNDPLDEALAVFFSGPQSFTGEDSAELHIHGGSWLISKCLNVLYQNGCRPALPGEFTQRAFENGKIDLTKAEGIKALIEASSEQEWLAARQLATGRLLTYIEDLRAKLLNAMAWVEATIDFPDEEETSSITMSELNEKIHLVETSIDELLATANNGAIARSGLQIAIFGPPNVGKSTLMNTLLGENRAIVTNIPGTTRDYLEEKCLLEGRLIRLIDTAGIRESNDEVELIGIERSLVKAKAADLVLILTSRDQGPQGFENAVAFKERLKPSDYLFVETKSDLKGDSNPKFISISSVTGHGISELKSEIIKRIDTSIGSIRNKTFVTEPRHIQALLTAKKSIAAFKAAQLDGLGSEIQAFELLEAARALNSIIGIVDSDEVLGVIFSSFCIGK
jgi:tRNA modification GTPase